MKKKLKFKILALTIAACAIFNVSLNTAYAAIPSEPPGQCIGGGPSPSGAWTHKKTTPKTFSASQLKTLSSKYQATINSGDYKRGQAAYNASVIALGFMGLKYKAVDISALGSAAISTFGKTYHSEIQRSANVLAAAAAKGKSVTLKVEEYYRPANGATVLFFRN